LWLEVASGAVYYSIGSMLTILALSIYVAYEAEADTRAAFLEHGMARSDATRDALTGLVNRRHFDAKLAELWRNHTAEQKPLTVLLIDIDHFKIYNDHYGHQAGDAALRRVANTLRDAARPQDVVARYGGEEFALIGTGLDEAGAGLLAERLRREVEGLKLPHAASPTSDHVSISVGGAWLVPAPGRSAEGALQLADENLYGAKQKGRNRVVFQTEEYDGLRTGVFRRTEFQQDWK
jgi:two-component system chemotaxis family response regulator WspR